MIKILITFLTLIMINSCSQSIDSINQQIKEEQEKGNVEAVYALYQKILDNFEGTEHYPTALFQMAFMNHNDFARFDLAKQQYQEFIEKFPNHELIGSAKFELKYIGVPVDEIPFIKDSLQQKTKSLVQ